MLNLSHHTGDRTTVTERRRRRGRGGDGGGVSDSVFSHKCLTVWLTATHHYFDVLRQVFGASHQEIGESCLHERQRTHTHADRQVSRILSEDLSMKPWVGWSFLPIVSETDNSQTISSVSTVHTHLSGVYPSPHLSPSTPVSHKVTWGPDVGHSKELYVYLFTTRGTTWIMKLLDG